MGMDIMKSNGTRCPPILVAGFLIMCLFMLCNWWSLSSQNSELIKQLDNLAEQLRINGEELGKCSRERSLLEEKLKDSQNKFVEQQIKMEQIKETQAEVKNVYEKTETQLQESKKKSESMEKNFKLCQIDMESLKKLGELKNKATEALRSENESLKSEIKQRDKQIKDLAFQFQSYNKTGNLLGNFTQPLVKGYKAYIKKIIPENSKILNDKELNNKRYGNQLLEDKFEERKNYGDSGLLFLDNDPREEAMKGS